MGYAIKGEFKIENLEAFVYFRIFKIKFIINLTVVYYGSYFSYKH